jgi:hypothetical protein
VWTFDGTLPPKLLQVRYGEAVLFRHYNSAAASIRREHGLRAAHHLHPRAQRAHTRRRAMASRQRFSFPGQFWDYSLAPACIAGLRHHQHDGHRSARRAPDGHGGIVRLRGRLARDA